MIPDHEIYGRLGGQASRWRAHEVVPILIGEVIGPIGVIVAHHGIVAQEDHKIGWRVEGRNTLVRASQDRCVDVTAEVVAARIAHDNEAKI